MGLTPTSFFGTTNILEVNPSPSGGERLIPLPSPLELGSLLLACGPAPGIDGILWEPHPVWALIIALGCVPIVGLIPMDLLLSLPSCVYWARRPVLGELGGMAGTGSSFLTHPSAPVRIKIGFTERFFEKFGFMYITTVRSS